MVNDPFAELLEVTNRKDLAEVGGSHNQKGVEFQRHWALMRMFELEQNGAADFLVLFETIQDLAILDSSTTPSSICLYQVKKKDRNEWAWTDLTALHRPKASGKSTGRGKEKPLSSVTSSPVGKLYAAIRAFKTLNSVGRFISNAGCDLPLSNGGNAATSLPSPLSQLSANYLELLTKALETLHARGEAVLDLSRIHLERVALPVDDPGTHMIGVIHHFLEQRSPRHRGQARSLLESLLTRIAPLGAKTDTCNSFDEICQQRGYSRKDFTDALGKLETLPDVLSLLETWLTQLSHEGMGFMEITAIRIAAASIYRRQVMGARSSREEGLVLACDAWLNSKPDPTSLKPFLEIAYDDLKSAYPDMKKADVLAYFALRAIIKCADLS